MSTGVLLACDDPELREQFLTVLAEAGHIEIVEIVLDAMNLLIAADREDVDVVVVHQGVDESGLGQVTQELLAARPFLPVLWLVQDQDPDTAARAMESGARGLLPVPLSLESTQPRIDAAAAWSRSLVSLVAGEGATGGRRGTIVALAGAKGGVGTTVLATLLAEATVGPGRSVVLVDLTCGTGPSRSTPMWPPAGRSRTWPRSRAS